MPTLAPAQVSTDTFTHVTAGEQFSCGRTTEGRLRCWGDDRYGQLGDGTTSGGHMIRPVQNDLVTDWLDVVAGDFHTCARRADQSLWCWGRNDHGQLASDNTGYPFRSVPWAVAADGQRWQSIALGTKSTCAVDTEGALWCAGNHGGNRIGLGLDHRNPSRVEGTWSRVSAGDHVTCAIAMNASLSCWGSNAHGNVGDGSDLDRARPAALAGRWQRVDVGDHVCAINDADELYCWGYNEYGAVGDGTLIDRATPLLVQLNYKVLEVAAARHTCALANDNTLHCWGRNFSGECGPNAVSTTAQPAQVPGAWSAISVGGEHSCGITTSNGAQCWGANQFGQLGDGTNNPRLAPASVTNLTSGVTSVSLGLLHSFAIAGTTASGWGYNEKGWLGNQTTNSSAIPQPLVGSYASVSSGDTHTCGIRTDGSLWCMGGNDWGQLGDGTYVQYHYPIQIGTDMNWTTVSAGKEHTCATKSDSSLWCWGRNESGQLGDGNAWSFTLARVN
jgi:alpha-tubulin suppressor-like RCC1 family protein